jgi:hypothetical protein
MNCLHRKLAFCMKFCGIVRLCPETNVKGLFMTMMLPVLFDLFGTFESDAGWVFHRYRPTLLCYEKFTHIFWG